MILAIEGDPGAICYLHEKLEARNYLSSAEFRVEIIDAGEGESLTAKLAAAEGLAVALDEATTDFLTELNYVYEVATGHSIEQDYDEKLQEWKAALRQYREAGNG